jgi:hypothetical protein
MMMMMMMMMMTMASAQVAKPVLTGNALTNTSEVPWDHCVGKFQSMAEIFPCRRPQFDPGEN